MDKVRWRDQRNYFLGHHEDYQQMMLDVCREKLAEGNFREDITWKSIARVIVGPRIALRMTLARTLLPLPVAIVAVMIAGSAPNLADAMRPGSFWLLCGTALEATCPTVDWIVLTCRWPMAVVRKEVGEGNLDLEAESWPLSRKEELERQVRDFEAHGREDIAYDRFCKGMSILGMIAFAINLVTIGMSL